MAQKWLPASSLTGGGEGALDAIDGSNVSDGDRAIVISDLVYFYVLDADSGLSESSPAVISPDSNAGDKRWVLIYAFPKILDLDTGNVTLEGSGDTVNDTASNSGVVGGVGNIIECADRSVILGGAGNKVRGSGIYHCYISGGYDNLIGGPNGHENGIHAGYSCFIKNGAMCHATGYQNSIASLGGYIYGAFVSGGNAHAYMPGQMSHANGCFDHNGDAQTSKLIYREETTDATETALSGDMGYLYMPLYREATWKFIIDVVARQVGGTAGTVGDSAMWRIAGGIKNIGAELTRGTVTLSGTISDGDSVTVGTTSYVFRDNPEVESTVPTAQSGSAAVAGASLAAAIKAHHPQVLDAVYDSGTVVITIMPEVDTAGNSIVLTCIGTNLSCDGGGVFGGTSEFSMGTNYFIGTPQGVGTPEVYDTDNAGTASQGTITMAGLPVADETFVVDAQTFTWKASRSTTGEVTIGADAAECVTNIVTAIGLDLTSVAAEDGAGDTVVLTASTVGSHGNSIVLTESSTNMAVDGTGTLGATTEGVDAGRPWEVNLSMGAWDQGLAIDVTGEANKTIHWVAKVELVEVG